MFKVAYFLSNLECLEELLFQSDINETFLFHQTNLDSIPLIILNGFAEEKSVSLPGIYGNGLIFTENSSRVDELTIPDQNGFCYMFLSRVCLGNPYLTETNLLPNYPPPISNIPLVKIHDSVIAECRKNSSSKFTI